jgi:hypothetical protein
MELGDGAACIPLSCGSERYGWSPSRGSITTRSGGDHIGGGQAGCRDGGDGAQVGAPGRDRGQRSSRNDQRGSAELRKLRAEIRELRRAMRFSSSGRPVLCRPGDYADSRSCWWGSWPSSTGTQDLVRFIAHRRMHSACYDLTSAEYELIHYGLVQQTAGLSPPESLDVPARFTPPVPLPR